MGGAPWAGAAPSRSAAAAKVCYGTDRDEAVRTFRRLWPEVLLPGETGQVLPSPKHFEQVQP